MSDRSDEVTESRRDEDARSPADVLEETERLLEETGGEAGSGTDSSADAGSSSASASSGSGSEPGSLEDPLDGGLGTDPLASESAGASATAETGAGAAPNADADAKSRLPSWVPFGGSSDATASRQSSLRERLTPSLSPSQYFSPKEFLAMLLVVGAGLLVGWTVLPVAGRMIGMFATAFLVGLLASKRRYLELTAAGISVGAVSSLVTHAFFAVAGSAQAVLAVGATVGLVATLVGYYFGRDLRNGLARDID
ncbi:hypothetical protein [Halopiger xanaduensis]|uniref:DUF456 domain-containing protein n=1 Tax=Halopiger xanaduensis (strain DSM 18323 / JCM 14033 / SH-6) TaxID=797210 RepID=F8D437_HALXS|nr:hypothetical protein [Halopiger xanaduensis]AEH36299.1 hypothetical protein Halxa_1667 [Halopiger xanaduensis SH-6]